MAIPVIVVGEVMGIAALIEHGVNGFCVATGGGGALAKLTRLANDDAARPHRPRPRTRMEQLAAEQDDAVGLYTDRHAPSAPRCR